MTAHINFPVQANGLDYEIQIAGEPDDWHVSDWDSVPPQLHGKVYQCLTDDQINPLLQENTDA